MTNEEAVVYLRHYLGLVNESKDNIDADYLSFLTGVHTLAIEALEKQIPKKPINHNCPCCGNEAGIGGYVCDYCPHCGQALDLSKENKT